MPNRTEEVASFRRRWYTRDIRVSRSESPSGDSCRSIAPPGGTPPPHQGRSNTEDRRTTTRQLISFAAQWSGRPIAPASQHTFSAQCSTKNPPTRWTRYQWGWSSPGCQPPYDHPNCGSPDHAGLREHLGPRLGLTVEALYLQPPLPSNVPGVVTTFVQTARPTEYVPGQGQDSYRAPGTVNVLTPTLNWVGRSRHTHICCFRSPAPALVVLCSPMPLVNSVDQVAAYKVCSHPPSVCPVDQVLPGICPNVMTLGSRPRALAFHSGGERQPRCCEGRCVHPPWGQACPQLGPLTGADPWGSTPLGSVAIPLSVLCMSVCVSFPPPAWLPLGLR